MIQQCVAEKNFLKPEEISQFVHKVCSGLEVQGKKVLVIIPDQTRSMPMPLMFKTLTEALSPKTAKLDYIIALGTHPPLPESMICKLLGVTSEELHTKYKNIKIINHAWQDPNVLHLLGIISKEKVYEFSNGLLNQEVPVQINRVILDYDVILIVGPVFPHEVVGFSGGNKYFFPGISGPDFLNVFHWLGALITNIKINGIKHTPVRQLIDYASSMIQKEKYCFALNVEHDKTRAIFFGTPEEAWDVAADLSARTHIIYKPRAYHSILAESPLMYDEIWTAGKCMYKLEPVVADDGELIIYGPHIKEISVTHGHLIRKIGYHTRDYFLAQMDKFRDIPGGILAHSTHVRGIGTYINGIEKPRVKVTLATSIPKEICEEINLGYRDPYSINIEDWKNREDEGILFVPQAGEILYRVKNS
ncbi:MAG TPA: lactate racemase domain-containing protein [Candidatus Hydrogenedens sp.]|nr:lactate racemase domain-containing protein [Candidatus Hydrogenedens sp.]HOL20380.1 lactate racemase domain-containing protein [Candidatus Hydrogenedens sp.]HPP58723.1 lactate racemase domain-containing protein [Candidatus Hydrogenedens sp.]